MDEVEKTYIELIKEYSKVRDYPLSKDTVKQYHQACKQMELKMTAKQIIQCVYEALNTPKHLKHDSWLHFQKRK